MNRLFKKFIQTSQCVFEKQSSRNANCNTTDVLSSEGENMSNSIDMAALNRIKEHVWFYEFKLPDGSKTQSYLQPPVSQIHATRKKVLRQYLTESSFSKETALDIACHEGYYSLVLSDYFSRVVGVDKNADSLELANLMLQVQKKNISYIHDEFENISEELKSDFVLCYGLLYHIDDPMRILRKLAALTRHSLCIETQILPFSVHGSIEDGYYANQRNIKGLFGLCRDYPSSKEGGTTEYALVPSLDALTFLLQEFGFSSVRVYEPTAEDYEQFVRKHRVILFAEK